MCHYSLQTYKHKFKGIISVEGTVVENTVSERDYHASFFLHNEDFPTSAQLTVQIENVTSRHNNIPFLIILGFYESDVLLKGKNDFYQNTGTIINLLNSWIESKLLLNFSTAEVSFNDNLHNPPILIDRGTIVFEHSRVSFTNNNGGILAMNSNIIFNDNVTIQFTNNNRLSYGAGGALSLED